MMRFTGKTAITAAAAVLVGAAGVGAAQASPTGTGRASALADAKWAAAPVGAGSTAAHEAPSSCRPANHLAEVTAAAATAGHRHYRVTLRAAPGYEACDLAGSPKDVRFTRDGSLDAVTAGRYGPQHTVVTFGPGHPVHFDVQVPDSVGGARADEVTFTLMAPGGEIPGESSADGSLTVDAGTLVGPIRPGA
jgi:hypothetical protein